MCKLLSFSEEAVLVSHRYRKIDNILNYAHNIRFSQLVMKPVYYNQKITLENFILDYSSLIKLFKDMFLLDKDPYDILSMMLPSSMMFLFEYTYNVSYGDKFYLKKKDCSIKKLTLFNKE